MNDIYYTQIDRDTYVRLIMLCNHYNMNAIQLISWLVEDEFEHVIANP